MSEDVRDSHVRLLDELTHTKPARIKTARLRRREGILYSESNALVVAQNVCWTELVSCHLNRLDVVSIPTQSAVGGVLSTVFVVGHTRARLGSQSTSSRQEASPPAILQ